MFVPVSRLLDSSKYLFVCPSSGFKLLAMVNPIVMVCQIDSAGWGYWDRVHFHAMCHESILALLLAS
jgi:hypothetical protein